MVTGVYCKCLVLKVCVCVGCLFWVVNCVPGLVCVMKSIIITINLQRSCGGNAVCIHDSVHGIMGAWYAHIRSSLLLYLTRLLGPTIIAPHLMNKCERFMYLSSERFIM